MVPTRTPAVSWSGLESASSALEISRDDIDGTLFRRQAGTSTLVLFDTVPGGAGGAVRIAEAFDEVLHAAEQRVRNCDCGTETSCYSCLRTYRNQFKHDQLRRDRALDALEALTGSPPLDRRRDRSRPEDRGVTG